MTHLHCRCYIFLVCPVRNRKASDCYSSLYWLSICVPETHQVKSNNTPPSRTWAPEELSRQKILLKYYSLASDMGRTHFCFETWSSPYWHQFSNTTAGSPKHGEDAQCCSFHYTSSISLLKLLWAVWCTKVNYTKLKAESKLLNRTLT